MRFEYGTPLDAETMELIWQELRQIYGRNFTQHWDDEDAGRRFWAKRLGGLYDWQIQHAMANLPDRAPNVVQFRKLAEQAQAPSGSFVPQGVADEFDVARPLTPEEIAHVQEVIARAKEAALARLVPLADGTLVSPHIAASARMEDGSPWPARRPDGTPWTFDIEGIASRMARGAELRGDWLRMFAARMERGDARIGVYQREQVKRAMRDGTIEPFAVDVPQALPAPPAPTPAPAPSRQPTVQVLDALDAPQEASWIDQWAAEALPV